MKPAATIICLVLVCAAISLAVGGKGPCDIPTRFWCNDKETAARCGVLKQCEANVWRQSVDKVNVEVYYGCMCPDCSHLISKLVAPNFDDLSSILNLTQVPYGFTEEEKVGDKWVFTCMFGEPECTGNIIETCAMHVMKDISKWMPFIGCMEGKIDPVKHHYPNVSAIECAKEMPEVPLQEILECSNSSLGNRLEHEMGHKTAALPTGWNWVPWVVVNGVHTEEMQKEAEKNFVKLVCDVYKGPKPPVCA